MRIIKSALKILSLCLALVVMLTALPMTVSASPTVVFEEVEDPVPVNPNANQTCKNFYKYLWNLRNTDKILSGAFSYKMDGVAGFDTISPEGDVHKLYMQEFGKTPVIFGSMDSFEKRINPEFTEQVAERYKAGVIPMYGYEPSCYRAGYAEGVWMGDWIVNLDATNPDRDMNMYNSYMNDLKIEADGFEAMEKAGVEVYMYRFFAEINNTARRGFYGETKEGFEALHRVWQQAVEYFTVERGLTGILFAFCACGYADSSDFYPGDDYVDIIAPTAYSNTGNGEIYAHETFADYVWVKNLRKPMGFTEISPRSFSAHYVPDAVGDYKKLVESVLYCYPEISFASTWYTDVCALMQPGNLTNYGNYNGLYYLNSPNVLYADDIPNFKTDTIESNGIMQFYSGKKYLGNLNLGKYSNKDLKAKGIDLSSVDKLDMMHGTALLAYASSDCTGKATIIYGEGQKLTKSFKNAKSVAVVSLENLAFEKNIWVEGHEDVSAAKLNDGMNALWDIDPDNGQISIITDLGKEYNIGQMSINHAGFYEDHKYNLCDFEIYVSNDNINYTLVYQNFGNVYPSSNFWFNPINARFVKLKVLTPNSSVYEIEKNRTSIAEIEVYGVESDNIVIGETSGEVIVDNNQNTTGSQGGVINLNQNNNTNNGTGNSDIGGTTGGSTDTDTNTENDAAVDPEPVIPAIVIPEFYNYVWIIIVGGILLIAGGISLLIFALNKKKNKVI